MSASVVVDARDLDDLVRDGLAVCTDCHTSDAKVFQPKPCPCCGTGLLLPIAEAVALGVAEVIPAPWPARSVPCAAVMEAWASLHRLLN